MGYSPLGNCVHGILQARILDWVALLPPGYFPNQGMEPISLKLPALTGRVVCLFVFLSLVPLGEAPCLSVVPLKGPILIMTIIEHPEDLQALRLSWKFL